MTEIEVRIDKTLDSTVVALLQFANGVFPNTRRAVHDATVFAKDTWQEIATRSFRHSTGTYINSIGIATDLQDPLHGLVICNHPAAKSIEEGYGPFDIKPGLLRSPKARKTKQGDSYIRVPLRHGVPRQSPTEAGKAEGRATLASVMPTAVAEIARQLVKQQSAGGGRARLPDMRWFLQTKLVPKRLGLSTYTWKTGKFAGLIRTETRGHTQYMTFRTVSAKKSPLQSWIHPGARPMRLCEQAKRESEPRIKMLIRAGFEKDLEELRQQIGGT